MELPDYTNESRTIQRRAEVLAAYATRPLGQRLDRFLKVLELTFSDWQRMTTNRAFRANVSFADAERVRFSTAHLTDMVSDVLDVQYNLAMRGDSSATGRLLQAAGVLKYGSAAKPEDGAVFVEAFGEQQAAKATDFDEAVKKDKESREVLDEMLACVQNEKAEEPPDLSMKPEG